MNAATLEPWLLLPGAYLLGSISPAYLVGRLKGIDLRQHGSGNLGATNAGRVLGTRFFFLIFALDVLKGVVPVLAAERLSSPYAGLTLATAACVLAGHTWTCFHRFRGGKAVATSLGVLFGLVPFVGATCFGIWVVVWAIGRLLIRSASAAVAPASLLAALMVPVTHVLHDPQALHGAHLRLTILLVLMTTLVVVRHRENIRKLLGGTRPAPTTTPAGPGAPERP